MSELPTWVIGVWACFALAELYLFLLQRSALEVWRDNNLPDFGYQLMLPAWYPVTWVFRIGKWACIIYGFVRGGWLTAAWMAGIPLILAAIVPVPHRQFFPLFYKRLKDLQGGPHAEAAEAIESALQLTDSRHRVTE